MSRDSSLVAFRGEVEEEVEASAAAVKRGFLALGSSELASSNAVVDATVTPPTPPPLTSLTASVPGGGGAMEVAELASDEEDVALVADDSTSFSAISASIIFPPF